MWITLTHEGKPRQVNMDGIIYFDAIIFSRDAGKIHGSRLEPIAATVNSFQVAETPDEILALIAKAGVS